jgi:hypothetical protein
MLVERPVDERGRNGFKSRVVHPKQHREKDSMSNESEEEWVAKTRYPGVSGLEVENLLSRGTKAEMESLASEYNRRTQGETALAEPASSVTECDHQSGVTRHFRGELTCDKCHLVIGHVEGSGQHVFTMSRVQR